MSRDARSGRGAAEAETAVGSEALEALHALLGKEPGDHLRALFASDDARADREGSGVGRVVRRDVGEAEPSPWIEPAKAEVQPSSQ